MAKYDLFIAYHGTYDQYGSQKKAEELYFYLKEHGVNVFVYSEKAGTAGIAFTETPQIAADSAKFLLVCNEHIKTDEEGRLVQDGKIQKGVFWESKAFWEEIYYGRRIKGNARVYGFGEVTSSMTNRFHPMFQGVGNFLEFRNGGNPCYEDVLTWVLSESEKNIDVSLESVSPEDIKLASLRLSKRSDYGLPKNTFTEALLPSLRYDGGSKLKNILEIEPEKQYTYIIYANGGAGKSCSVKSLWIKFLKTAAVPLYVSVRTCSEKYDSSGHPLFEYLKDLYHIPLEDVRLLPKYFKENPEDWILLVDGYNETEDIGAFLSDLNEIDDYCTVFITARDKTTVKGLDTTRLYALRILPLEEDTVKEYIASLNNPVLMNLLSDPNMLMMLRNPMLLTMFCNSFDAEGYDLDLNGETLTLTPGELIEHCVVAQLWKSGSRNLRTFFDILCLFPMVIADMYYKGTLRNMSVSRIELSKALTSLLQNLDTDTLEAFYLPEYADKWQLDDTSNEEFDSLMTFLREHKPLEIRNEFGIFERVMSKVLQFFTMDDERSRIGGNSYRFDHQTSFNWYISYGIYIMAELMPQRFSEIIRDLTDGVDLSMEKTDDFEEQSEFIFDLIRDYAEDEDYRHFAAKLHNVHFKRRTSRIYHIAVNCISLFDKADVSDEEYANEVASFCFSLFGLGKRNTPPGMNEEDIVRKYGEKLETVKKKAARIKNEEDRNVCLAKIYTIEGAYNLALFRLYKASHKDSEETWEVLKNYALQAGEFQKKALKIREDVIANGSGKYTDEMKNRIAYSYTSLGTVAYNLKEFEKSVEYHKKALALREEIAGDPGIAEWIRKDAKLSESVNLSRINGSTMARGNLTKEELLEIFKREDLLSETRIETEMIDRVKTFAKEITFIQDEEVLDKAYATYELLFDAYAKMFGFQSPELIKAGNSLDALRYEFNPVLSANEKIDRFIKSDAFQTVVKIFNDGNEMTDLEKLNEFADHWDYRRKMASGGERQAIQTEDPFVAEHREEIIRSFRKLGMLDEKKEDFPVPDYILPLGGFGASNLKRLELAKKIHDMYPDQNVRVVALSSQRPLTDPNEFDAIKDFAPDAKTEFEEVDEAMKCAFRLTNPPVLETHNEPGTREYWTLSRYQSENPAQIFDNLSAPCTDPNRQRANTADTFRHFLKCFDVKKGSVIFLVSTSLYEPYQTFTILPDAIEAGVKLTFIGGAYKEHDEEIIATLCLCDLKSAVNAMASFRRRFPK